MICEFAYALMQKSPVHVLTVRRVVIVHATRTTTLLRAVTGGDIGPLGVCGEDEVHDDAGAGSNLERDRVHVLTVHVSLLDVELVVSYNKHTMLNLELL